MLKELQLGVNIPRVGLCSSGNVSASAPSVLTVCKKSSQSKPFFFHFSFSSSRPPPPPPTSQIASGLLIAAHSTLQMLLLRDFSKMNFVVSWQIIICLLAMENHSGSTFLDKTSTVQILIKYNGKAICEWLSQNVCKKAWSTHHML